MDRAQADFEKLESVAGMKECLAFRMAVARSEEERGRWYEAFEELCTEEQERRLAPSMNVAYFTTAASAIAINSN
jgi:hypothetical protein